MPRTPSAPTALRPAQVLASALRRWSIVVAALAAAAIAFGRLWPQDLESTAPSRVLIDHAAFMCGTFWFHGALACGAAGLLLLALRSWKAGAAACMLGLLATGPMLPRGGGEAGSGSTQETLTVMSVNLLYARENLERLLPQIERLEPDVILCQEYSPAWDAVLPRALGATHPHRVLRPRRDAFGAAVFSSKPFDREPRVFMEELVGGSAWDDPQILIEVSFDGAPVELRNVHLLPPASMGLVREQRLQAAALARSVPRHAGSLVLGGDFNATGNSEHLAALRRAGLVSTHEARGVGRGATWPRLGVLRRVPGVRLDHVLHTADLECVESGVGEDFGSDHRPVWARFIRTRRSTP